MGDNNFFNNQDNNNYNKTGQDNFNSNDSYGANTYSTAQSRLDVEAKAQSVLSKTFLFMFMALLITAVSAYMTISTGFIYELREIYGPLLIAEVAVVFLANFTLQKDNVVLSAIMFLAYSIINGVTLSVIFVAYELGSVVSIFVLAAIIFGCMAAFGLVTKKDLSSLGTIGMMGLIGIIVLGIANIFIGSEGLSIGLAAVGLAVFIGLTAYDMQNIKDLARSNIQRSETSLALYGALILYLDFINIFIKLLRLFGNRND